MRKLLFSIACAAALPAAAHGEQRYWKNSTTLATSGYWSAIRSDPPACDMITTGNSGLMEIGTVANAGLSVVFFKSSWNIPAGTKTSVAIEIDGGQRWGGHDNAVAALDADGHGLYMPIDDNDRIEQFIKELLTGHHMTVYFRGSEQPWEVNLQGLNEISQAFFRCVKDINPNEGAAPFRNVPQGPPSAVPSPSQPFEAPPSSNRARAQPIAAKPQRVLYMQAEPRQSQPGIPGARPEGRHVVPQHRAHVHRHYARRHYYYYRGPNIAKGLTCLFLWIGACF